MKKSTLGILTAAAVGESNLILQNADQASYQDQLNLGAYGIPTTPEVQTSVQGNGNDAAAIGGYNVIDQDATQTNVQGQVDVQQYIPPSLQY